MDPQNNSAKFAFFYMLSLVALIFMALSVGMIIFQIINKNVVDVIDQFRGRYSSHQLKFAISALIVAAPIFYFAMRQIYQSLFSGALSKDSGVRKWLTYFVLFVASVVMLGWLTATVNSYLDGELTTKFILKAITAIGIAATIFTFYLYDIKREEVVGRKDKTIQRYFYGSLFVVVVVFVASLFFVESPSETRDRKQDGAILDKFNQIDSAINTYYNDYGKLPEDLDALVADITFLTDKDIKDLVSGEKFGYSIIATSTYELCATFKTDNKDNENDYKYFDKRWLHSAGYQCLSQKVRDNKTKELAPVPMR